MTIQKIYRDNVNFDRSPVIILVIFIEHFLTFYKFIFLILYFLNNIVLGLLVYKNKLIFEN